MQGMGRVSRGAWKVGMVEETWLHPSQLSAKSAALPTPSASLQPRRAALHSPKGRFRCSGCRTRRSVQRLPVLGGWEKVRSTFLLLDPKGVGWTCGEPNRHQAGPMTWQRVGNAGRLVATRAPVWMSLVAGGWEGEGRVGLQLVISRLHQAPGPRGCAHLRRSRPPTAPLQKKWTVCATWCTHGEGDGGGG